MKDQYGTNYISKENHYSGKKNEESSIKNTLGESMTVSLYLVDL